ncbi:Sfi1-domain-containing protein, partial [Rhizodiscina lignyota]
MVAGRADTDTLASRFKNLLSSQGIVVDFDMDDEGVDDITRPLEEEETQNGGRAEGISSSRGSRQQSRRTSFNSIYEAGAWKTGENLDDSSPRPERPTGHRRASSRASDPSGERRRSIGDRRHLLEQLPIRGRVNNRSVSDNLHSQRRPRSASISSQGSIQVIRRAESASNRSRTSRNASRSRRSSQASIDRKALPPEIQYHPSETQMLADVDTFQYHSNIRLQRRWFWHWRDQARSLSDQHEKLSRMAEAFDRRSVFRAALGSLYFTFRDKQEARAVERAHAREERRVQRLYNLHIMEKAFEHWAVTARERVARTATARRHMLRFKFFNAWRDVTVVNELKVRRQRLNKFFGVWKRRTAAVLKNDDLAIGCYEENLVSRVYRKWFWEFHEHSARYFAEDRIRRNFFRRWRYIVWKMKQREGLVEQMRVHDEQRRILEHWQQRLEVVRRDEDTAEAFRRRKLLSNTLTTFSIQAKLAPAYHRISGGVDSRIVLSALRKWHLRARQSQQAAEVNRLRLLRNALTSWDDQLRCSWLSRRIDDRVTIEALYRLSIASKASMFARVRNYKLLHKWTEHWSTRTRERASALQQAVSNFQQAQTHIILRDTFSRWRGRFDAYREDEALAIDVFRSHAIPKRFNRWHSRTQDIMAMESQASAARFYILTTNTIKLWHGATEQSQKQRRREAYVTVRRRCKMNLVREMVSRWRSKADTIRAMERNAVERAENITMGAAIKAFADWRQKSQQITQWSAQAVSYRQTHLLRVMVTKLVATHGRFEQLDAKALNFKAEMSAITAQKLFTKLGWRLFQVRRLAQNALALKDKHWHS